MLEYVLLGMLSQCSMTGYDLKKALENGVGVFYRASFGSIYPALGRLEQKGRVRLAQADASGRRKKVYEITEQGRVHFQEWLCRPIRFEEQTSHHLLKIYFFDQLSREVRSRLLTEYEINNRNYLQQLLELKKELDSPQNRIAHYYKLATLYYGIRVLETTVDWCVEIREKEGEAE